MLPRICVLMLLFVHCYQSSSQQPSPEQTKQAETVLRDPFNLKLKLKDGSNYERHFQQIPYTKDGVVYIFPGENFGVTVNVVGNEISGLVYEKNIKKADLVLDFKEETMPGGVMMLLSIQSKLKQTLYMDAAMQVPDREGNFKTSILPALGGKAGFESWPHPITMLELKKLRFTAKAPPS